MFKPERFDAIILDLHLPDVSGKFVYDNLKQDQIIVVMSGDPLLLEDYPLRIAKPFRPKELLNFLKEIL
ncbi:MAG TPA: response regulator transcription factor [Phycisphaerales bacterium]|nr:response regulator transcription factor [Phycisphaerales bacterium]